MNNNSRNLVRSALFLAIAIIFQIIGRFSTQSQVIVGPIVNTVLIMTCAICGIFWGILVAILTPLLAFAVGQLNPAFGPFVPFIMIGNILFIIFFGMFMRRKNSRFRVGILPVIGLILGAIAKFLFLKFSSTKLIGVFSLGIPKEAAKKLAGAMSTPQLITALAGGIIALIILAILAKRKQI